MSWQIRVRKLLNLDIKKEIISKQESGKSIGDLTVCSYFSIRKIVYALQIYMYSVQKLNKSMFYSFYTYIFDFVLYVSCLNGYVGW